MSETQFRSYPNLQKLALDTFSILPTSSEVERIFSGARRTILWEHSQLTPNTIEQVECLKHWMKNGLIYSKLLSEEDFNIESFNKAVGIAIARLIDSITNTYITAI